MVKVLIYTGCFLAVVGICLYGYFAIDSRGYDRGVNETEAEWREKQVVAKENQIKSIQQYRDALRLQGIELQKSVADLGEQQSKEEENVERGKDILLDAIYSGRIKLHIPTAEKGPGNGAVSGGSTAEGDSGTTEGRCVSEAQGELPVETTAFLYGEGTRANKLVRDYNYMVDYTNLLLATCQADE